MIDGFTIALPQGMFQQQEESEPADQETTALAQSMDLRSAWAKAHEHHEFTGGELVQEKEGLTMFGHHNRPPVLLFWRYLDDGDHQDQILIDDYLRRHMVSRVDCLIARRCQDHLHLIPHDSTCLEPYTGPTEEQPERGVDGSQE